jgi:hypothetical protein
MRSHVRLTAALLFVVESMLVTGHAPRLPESQGGPVLRACAKLHSRDEIEARARFRDAPATSPQT